MASYKMNNFNNVFLAIKKHSDDNGIVRGWDMFENIANETRINLPRLEFILDTLQHLDLIRYSLNEQYIQLTAFGKRQHRLFMDE